MNHFHPLPDPVDPDDCIDDTATTCETTKENVVDIFYYDEIDFFSCEQKCIEIDDCHYWSQFSMVAFDSPVNKCFLFRTCDNTEACIDCVTGEVP